MNIVIFGVGDYFNSRKHTVENRVKIVGYIDNNPNVCGKYIKGIRIGTPKEVIDMTYDFIVIMSVFASEMRHQLQEIGVSGQKIKTYTEFYGELEKGKLTLWFGKNGNQYGNIPKILIIFNFLRYSSAHTLNLNIMDALIKEGFEVSVATVAGETRCIEEIREKGINVLTFGNMHFAEKEEFYWIKDFDCIIVNNVYMIDCVSVISELKPVIWWLHEPENYVRATIELDENYNKRNFDSVDICAVSAKAKEGFWKCDKSKKIKILPIGIKDERLNITKGEKKRVVFAIIGYVGPIKGQDLFVDAIDRLSGYEKENAEFWIIGHIGEVGFGSKIQEKAKGKNYIKILGEKSKQELNQLYREIDVVVIASRTETLSLVAIEGMMHGKVCIVSDSAGIAEYISSGKNGFLYKSEDIDELASIMRNVIFDKGGMEGIALEGRKTYEDNFSLNSFSRRLKDEIEVCVREWDS